jgi:two-component system response regulator (stage 0 sporulation protein F)
VAQAAAAIIEVKGAGRGSEKAINTQPALSYDSLNDLGSTMQPQEGLEDRASRAKILVIEDEEAIRTLIKRALEPSYDVHLASHGREGLSLARWVKPDLILLDLRMPGLDGLAVLAKLKANQQTSAIPVVIVSVQGETDMLLESQRAGAVDHVIKPFDIDDLRKVIQRQLATRRD